MRRNVVFTLVFILFFCLLSFFSARVYSEISSEGQLQKVEVGHYKQEWYFESEAKKVGWRYKKQKFLFPKSPNFFRVKVGGGKIIATQEIDNSEYAYIKYVSRKSEIVHLNITRKKSSYSSGSISLFDLYEMKMGEDVDIFSVISRVAANMINIKVVALDKETGDATFDISVK